MLNEQCRLLTTGSKDDIFPDRHHDGSRGEEKECGKKRKKEELNSSRAQWGNASETYWIIPRCCWLVVAVVVEGRKCEKVHHRMMKIIGHTIAECAPWEKTANPSLEWWGSSGKREGLSPNVPRARIT